MNNEWEKQGIDSLLIGDKIGRIIPLKNNARVIPTPIHNNDNVKKVFLPNRYSLFASHRLRYPLINRPYYYYLIYSIK